MKIRFSPGIVFAAAFRLFVVGSNPFLPRFVIVAPQVASCRSITSLRSLSASAVVGLAAAGVDGQLDTVGRDLDHPPATPDHEGYAQLLVSLDYPAASRNDGQINCRSVPNDSLDVTR